MKNNQYFTADCNGVPLQFTGSGRAIQCDPEQPADLFNSVPQAQAALDRAEEAGGSVHYWPGTREILPVA